MLPFQTIQLSDRAQLEPILYRLKGFGCEYSFANLFLWGPQRTAVVDGFVLVITRHAGADSYLFPAGEGNLRQAVLALAADARERRIPLSIYALTERERDYLQQSFPGCFRYFEVRSAADYVYHIERLAELAGKKLQAKRNHIHRFEATCPDWQTEPITRACIPDCQRMTERWYASHEQEHPEVSYAAEKHALDEAFTHFEQLHFEGLLLRREGEVIAFTMGNRIREDTFDVNFEKAFGEIPGDYAMINREFAVYLREKYPALRLLNREDDMGIEGLRKAKLSYYPDVLLQKWVAVAHPEELLQ